MKLLGGGAGAGPSTNVRSTGAFKCQIINFLWELMKIISLMLYGLTYNYDPYAENFLPQRMFKAVENYSELVCKL